MKRRDLLALAGVSVTASLAGCLGDDDDDDDDDDTDEEQVAATFEVSGLDPVDVTAEVGETVAVSATITNTGDESGETTVELRLDGETQASEDIDLDDGEDETVSFEVESGTLEPGEYTHSIWTDDDEASGTLTIEAEPAAFELSDLDPETPTLTVGETLTVSGVVTNVGGQEGEVPVELRLDGDEIDSETVTVPAGDSETVDLSVDTADLDLTAGEYTHSLWTEDDEVSGTLTLEAAELDPGTLDLTVVDADAAPIEGASVTGDGIDETTGDEGRLELELDPGEYELTVEAGSLEQTVTVEILEGETTTEEVELVETTEETFEAVSTDGFISFDEDNETDARDEGLDFPEDGVEIEGVVENGQWESTYVDFEPLDAPAGLTAEVEAIDGLSGTLDREEEVMTVEGELEVDVDGDTFQFEIAPTTGESGALSGNADFDGDEASVTVVDNEYIVDDEMGNAILDGALGLPLEEPGLAWLEIPLEIEFQ